MCLCLHDCVGPRAMLAFSVSFVFLLSFVFVMEFTFGLDLGLRLCMFAFHQITDEFAVVPKKI